MCENLKSVSVNGVTVINMTMHDIVYKTETDTITFPGNANACVRVFQEYVPVGNPFGLRMEIKAGEKRVEGLPKFKEGTFYIVSGLVRAELPERKDLIAPTQNVEHQEKNEKGHTVSISYFETNLC